MADRSAVSFVAVASQRVVLNDALYDGPRQGKGRCGQSIMTQSQSWLNKRLFHVATLATLKSDPGR
jgi:hypothetical protein